MQDAGFQFLLATFQVKITCIATRAKLKKSNQLNTYTDKDKAALTITKRHTQTHIHQHALICIGMLGIHRVCMSTASNENRLWSCDPTSIWNLRGECEADVHFDHIGIVHQIILSHASGTSTKSRANVAPRHMFRHQHQRQIKMLMSTLSKSTMNAYLYQIPSKMHETPFKFHIFSVYV